MAKKKMKIIANETKLCALNVFCSYTNPAKLISDWPLEKAGFHFNSIESQTRSSKFFMCAIFILQYNFTIFDVNLFDGG